jgi:hypothetical protein
MRRLAVRLLLLPLAAASCVGDDGFDCGDATAPLPAVEESAAAARATSCVPALEFDGTTFIQVDCEPPVRRAFLGPVVARNAGYVARSIDGVPTNTALAIRHLPEHAEGCRGWQFWADGDRDEQTMTNLLKRVNRGGTLS